MSRRVTLMAALAAATLSGGAAAEQTVADPATGCRIRDQYPDARKSIRWSGACRNGFADGPGVLEWAYDGRHDGRARGSFVDGRMEGRAQVEWRDGRRMDGTFRQGRAEGEGTFVWPDGRRYSGAWRDDRRTGFGTLEYPDGRRLVGEFHRNRFVGPPQDPPSQDPPSQAAEAPPGRWSSRPESLEDWLRNR